MLKVTSICSYAGTELAKYRSSHECLLCSMISELPLKPRVLDVLQTLYNAALENNCSEQASRMAAMESSTKNATEMLGKLTLSYNR